ncbi:hypothetical protein MAPG_08954 [Magnaporthiopsis poae ATCC 64411]|uniref:Heterokaryon incompatibility domain-containing protein n=1 Tax=Magnaporthiopsis poae (strain ATCC 64411 / 73-15) TaxID=644358 RepID=A0A0C4E8P0_MAGP6|nr:hypothetical protein MAPG_08954 [Magnaporthiopsis poae ATCC 64411]
MVPMPMSMPNRGLRAQMLISAKTKTACPDIGSSNLGLVGLPDLDQIQLTQLHNFLARSWFTRAWIVQEAALAEPVRSLLGLLSPPRRALTEMEDLSQQITGFNAGLPLLASRPGKAGATLGALNPDLLRGVSAVCSMLKKSLHTLPRASCKAGQNPEGDGGLARADGTTSNLPLPVTRSDFEVSVEQTVSMAMQPADMEFLISGLVTADALASIQRDTHHPVWPIQD